MVAMGIIHVLPLSVVNKIAAGEVIERPASLLKELIENSLDAGATAIRIDIEDGGKQLVRISDNGSGFYADDLPLAFAAHATSKLAKPEDLFRISTLGFRGEALASIGAISQARIISRRKGELTGAEIECRGGEISHPKPAGCAEGTTVEVRNLFFNTPARRKFLRSTPVELGHCVDMVTRFAIAHRAVRFDLAHDGNAIFALPGRQEFRERVEYFFGPELAASLIRVEVRDSGLGIEAFIAPPFMARASAKMQFIYVNGRYIRERVVSRALAQAYKGFIPNDRYPVAVLFITVDPAEVDVNVHPTKIEVRFRNVWRLHDMIVDSVRALLSTTQGAVPIKATGVAANGGATSLPTAATTPPDVKSAILDFFLGPRGAETPSRPPNGVDDAYAVRRPTKDNVRSFSTGGGAAAVAPPPLGRTQELSSLLPPSSFSTTAPFEPPPPAGTMETLPHTHPPHEGQSASAQFPSSPRYVVPELPPGETRSCFQIHDSYIIEQVEDGILIVDQHALHERILLTQLRKRLEAGSGGTQRLLIPAVIEFTKAEMLFAKEILPHMERLGFEVNEFGPNTIAVYAVPDILSSTNPETILRGVVEDFEGGTGKDGKEEAVLEILNSLACKAAIKAGEKLTHEEIVSLLRQRESVEQASTCAHGRPTTLKISLAELKKYFKRA